VGQDHCLQTHGEPRLVISRQGGLSEVLVPDGDVARRRPDVSLRPPIALLASLTRRSGFCQSFGPARTVSDSGWALFSFRSSGRGFPETSAFETRRVMK